MDTVAFPLSNATQTDFVKADLMGRNCWKLAQSKYLICLSIQKLKNVFKYSFRVLKKAFKYNIQILKN